MQRAPMLDHPGAWPASGRAAFPTGFSRPLRTRSRAIEQPDRQKSKEKLELARRFYEEGWSAADLDSLDALVAEDHVQEDRVWQAQPRHGRESLKRGIGFMRRSYPDIRFKVDAAALTEDGTQAFVRTMTGTFEGEADTAYGAALLTLNEQGLISRTEVFRQATRAEVVGAKRSEKGPVPQGALLDKREA